MFQTSRHCREEPLGSERFFLQLLRRVAGAHPKVAKDLPAQVFLTNVANGTANFELRVWTDQSENLQQVRSDLLICIRSVLAAEKVALR